VSSAVGRAALPFNGPYGASKHAIEAIADAWRGELHRSNVSVTLIEPGSVNTPIWDKSRADTERTAIPPQLAEQYGHVPSAVEKAVARGERFWIAPERVAKAIQRALAARRPRTRYLVGPDARGVILAKTLLTDRTFDRLARRVIGV
jgi:short-subunit dehydrogenase